MTIFDIREIFDSSKGLVTPGTAQAFRDAEVILGVDKPSGRTILVFGKALLEEIAKSRRDKSVRMIHIGIDEETEDLEQLIALVQAFKGRHDYESRQS